MNKVKCPGCKKPFKTTQGKGNHVRYCKYVQERPELTPTRLTSTPSAPEKSIPSKRQEPWDVNWSQAEKEGVVLRGMELTWGIGRRGGRWVPIPVLFGMDYDSAVVAADRRNVVSRIQPVLAVHRPSQPAQEPDRDDDLCLALLLLDTL